MSVSELVRWSYGEIFEKVNMACITYGGGERRVQGFGGET